MASDTSSILSPKTLFRIVATAEAITWAALISGLIIRAAGVAPEWLISVVGGAHGFTFLSYAVMAALVGVNQRWPILRIAFGVVLAIVPFATVPFERVVAKPRKRLMTRVIAAGLIRFTGGLSRGQLFWCCYWFLALSWFTTCFWCWDHPPAGSTRALALFH